MIQFSSQLIWTGTETQINLKPIISETSEDAIWKFSPPTLREGVVHGTTNIIHGTTKNGSSLRKSESQKSQQPQPVRFENNLPNQVTN